MEQFFCKTKILSGSGSLRCLADLHIKRLLIVSDPFFFENGPTDRISQLSQAESVEIFHDVTPDPSTQLVAKATKLAQNFQVDTILALGGGSAMDCAKAIAFFSALPVRLIAVPTTSGSGSEVTNFAILTHEGVKHPLVDEKLQPDIAILDGELLASLPQPLIADTGFDLIAHALEAWVASGAGQISDSLALGALKTAFAQLPRSFSGDLTARSALHTAATMAGMAFSSAGLGLCHAISHSLGGAFHKPHGRLNAILLPAVVECNSEKAGHRYACLARQLGFSTGADPIAQRMLKNALLQLRRQLNLPDTLAQIGISPATLREQTEQVIAAALADPCCQTNPVQPEAHHIRKILASVMGHG